MIKRSIALLSFLLLFAIPTHAADITTTTCPGAGCVDYDVSAQGTIGIQITGTFSGTITFQGSVDGTTFVSLAVQSFAVTDGSKVTTATAPGAYFVSTKGLTAVRVVFTSFVSGTATVTQRMIKL